MRKQYYQYSLYYYNVHMKKIVPVLLFQFNQYKFAYHCVLDDGLNTQSNNEEFDLKGAIVEIIMNETMITKYYQEDLQYEYLHINNIC